MKKTLLLLTITIFIAAAGCRVKYGCPSSGRNLGAERLLSGEKEAKKQAKHAGKFRS